MMWLILTVLLMTFAGWYYRETKLKYWSNLGAKRTKPLIFFSDIIDIAFRKKDIGQWLDQIYYLHPKSRYTGCYQMTVPNLMIRDPELIKQITVKDFGYFTDHQKIFSDESDPLWSKNLFSLKGQKWRDMRATLSSSFTTSKIKYMFSVVSTAVDDFVNHFLKKNESITEVELKDIFTKFTNDVVATTAFGLKVDTLSDPENEFYIRGKEATNFSGILLNLKLLLYMLFPKLCDVLKISFFSKRVSNFFNTLVRDSIKAREEQGIVRPNMINILLEIRKELEEKNKDSRTVNSDKSKDNDSIKKMATRLAELTYSDIVSQAMIFFLAGFDTVARAMCYALYELACNPEVQEMLRKEIMETLNEGDGTITYDALLKMKYLNMVISETLRKWPTTSVIDRICTKAYIIQPELPDESPVHVQVGDEIMIPIFSIQRDPKYFPEPEKFIPERFANEEDIKPYTYLPFGSGPRICIASRFSLMEVKAIVCGLLAKFQVVPTKKTEIPLKMCAAPFGIMQPKNGFWVGLKRL